MKVKKESIDAFFISFISSGIASQFETGNPTYVSGLSGIDLYRAVKADYYTLLPDYQPVGCSREYWVGWSLAYYQWISNKSFGVILAVVPASEMVTWYTTLHEADITVFVDAMEQRFNLLPSRLKLVRSKRGLTQAQLSQLSGVSMRLIQQYEQKQQNIMFAPYNVMSSLCNVLNCIPSELIEPTPILPSNFSSCLMQRFTEQNSRKNMWQIGNKSSIAAQSMADCYGYISQFPNEAIEQKNRAYQINTQQFYDNWNMYWNKIAEERTNQQQAKKMIRKLAKEAVGEAIHQSGNQELSAAYDVYSIISADSLAEAIVKTAQYLSAKEMG